MGIYPKTFVLDCRCKKDTISFGKFTSLPMWTVLICSHKLCKQLWSSPKLGLAVLITAFKFFSIVQTQLTFFFIPQEFAFFILLPSKTTGITNVGVNFWFFPENYLGITAGRYGGYSKHQRVYCGRISQRNGAGKRIWKWSKYLRELRRWACAS